MALDEIRRTPEAQGKRIAYLREDVLKIPQIHFAKEIPVSKNTLSCWENGNISRPIQQRNMVNLIQAFGKFELKVTERWIRTGDGPPPEYKGEAIELNNVFLPLSPNSSLGNNPEEDTSVAEQSTDLATSLFNEIKLFTKTFKHAVIAKVNHAGLAPYYEKGDWVGGVWQDSDTLIDGLIYIVELNPNQLHVAQVNKTAQDGQFKLTHKNKDLDPLKSFQTTDIYLKRAAQVIRFWR